MKSSILAAVGGVVEGQNASDCCGPRLTEASYRFPRAMLNESAGCVRFETAPLSCPDSLFLERRARG